MASTKPRPTPTATTAPAKTALPNQGRPGYKLTKLGWIPEEWEVKPLGDLGEIAMCKRIFKEETTANGEVPFFKIGTFGGEPDAFITRDKFEEYRRRFSFPKVGDILLSAAGTIGRTVVYDGRPAYFQDSNLVWIDNDDEQVLNSYLYYLYPRIKWETDTSTIPRLYNESIRQTRILAPPLPEQRRIAAVLGAWDRAIATAQELLAAQQERKRGLMQELLTGKRRFPGFGGKWKEVRLGQIASIKKGIQLNGEHLTDLGPYPAMNGGITPSGYTDEWNTEAGTIAISEGGNSCGYVSFMPNRFWCGGHCYAVAGYAHNVSQRFLYHALKFRQAEIMRLRVGSGLPNVQIKALLSFHLEIPSLDEQVVIEKVLTDADRVIEVLTNYLDLLTTQKRGLMQQLLTGAVRVKV